MFSPSSGSLNSVTSAASDTAAGAGVGATSAGACDFGAGDGAFCAEGEAAGAGAAAFAGDAARATLPEPLSTVKITWPTLIFSPSLTRTSFTTPLIDEGTSTTTLSVSSSITDWPSNTFAPPHTITPTTPTP